MTIHQSWDGKPLDAALADVRELLEDPTCPTVHRWREDGGKVVGHFQVYFPEEIAHAAGLLPVKVHGAAVEARQSEARFGSYLCSIVKTSLELALDGRLPLIYSSPIQSAMRRATSPPCGDATSATRARSLPAAKRQLTVVRALSEARIRPAAARDSGRGWPGN